MNFVQKAASFDLFQHIDPNHPDVRVQTRELFQRTQKAVAREKEINLEVVLLIGCLERKNAAVNLGLGSRENLANQLGLTINQYWKRAQAGRILMKHPEFIDLIQDGKTHISHVALLAPKLTPANKDIFLSEVPGKSERQIRELVACVRKDGSCSEREPILDVRLQLSKSQLALLDRAREILSFSGRVPSESEAVVRALEVLVEKIDPVKKAERATQRLEKKRAQTPAPKSNVPSAPKSDVPSAPKSDVPSAPIPASVRHEVVLRDGACCSYVDENGNRCGTAMTLQLDHIVPVAHNGSNNASNVRLLCRRHNVSEASRLLGADWMDQFRKQ